MATYIPQKKEDDAGTGGTDLLVPVLARRNDALAARGNTDGDYVSLAADSAGVQKVANFPQVDLLMNGVTQLTPKFAAIAAATSGDNTIIAANASKKFLILAIMIVAGAAGNIYFTSGAGGTVIFGGSTNKINLAANGGFVLPFSQVGWFVTLATNTALVMNASSTGPFSGGVVYVEI